MRSKGNGKAPPSVPPRYGMGGRGMEAGRKLEVPVAFAPHAKKKSLENTMFSRLFVLVEISGIEPLTS